MTIKKGRQFFKGKNRMTPSVAAPGDTKLSDATANVVDGCIETDCDGFSCRHRTLSITFTANWNS